MKKWNAEVLWCAVLLRAFLDATRFTDDQIEKLRAVVNKRFYTCTPTFEARRWFKHGGDDFEFVCHAAGYDPDHVRQVAMDAMKNGIRIYSNGNTGGWNTDYMPFTKKREMEYAD